MDYFANKNSKIFATVILHEQVSLSDMDNLVQLVENDLATRGANPLMVLIGTSSQPDHYDHELISFLEKTSLSQTSPQVTSKTFECAAGNRKYCIN